MLQQRAVYAAILQNANLFLLASKKVAAATGGAPVECGPHPTKFGDISVRHATTDTAALALDPFSAGFRTCRIAARN